MIVGCDRIWAGYDNCYALALAKRLKAMGQAKYQVDGDVRTFGLDSVSRCPARAVRSV